MLGSQTQFPSITGAEQFIPHGAGARLRFAHESATAAAGIARAAATTAPTRKRLIPEPSLLLLSHLAVVGKKPAPPDNTADA
jgi:hypothetical protein